MAHLHMTRSGQRVARIDYVLDNCHTAYRLSDSSAAMQSSIRENLAGSSPAQISKAGIENQNVKSAMMLVVRKDRTSTIHFPWLGVIRKCKSKKLWFRRAHGRKIEVISNELEGLWQSLPTLRWRVVSTDSSSLESRAYDSGCVQPRDEGATHDPLESICWRPVRLGRAGVNCCHMQGHVGTSCNKLHEAPIAARDEQTRLAANKHRGVTIRK